MEACPTSRFVRARFAIFAGLLLLLAVGSWLILRDFRIDNSVGIWFAQDDSELVEYEATLDTYGHLEWTMLMVETDSIEAPGFVEAIGDLVDELAAVDHVERVVSIADLPAAAGPPEGLLARLVEDDFARGLLVQPGDLHHTVLLLQTDDYPGRQDPYRMAMVDDIHATAQAAPVVTSHALAGTSVINAELNRNARFDMFVFFSLVTVMVFGFSLVMFRSLEDSLVLLSVVAGAVVFSMGLIAAAGYSLNMVTLMLPTVLIALSVADGVHVIATFHAVRGEHGAEGAVFATIREVWLPCLGTTVTTIVGFLSLSVSTVLPVYQLAVFGAAGIAMAYLIALTVVPLALYQLWRHREPTARPPRSEPHPGLRWIVGWLRHRPVPIVLLFVLAGSGLAGLWQLDADTNYAEFFRSGSTVPMDYAMMDEAGYAQNPLVLTVAFPADTPLLQADAWSALGRLSDALGELPEVEYVLSPVSVARSAGLDLAPADSPVGLVDPVGLVAPEQDACQLVLLTDYMSSNDLHRLMGEIEATGAETTPTGTAIGITGTTVLWATMDTQVIRTQVGSALIVSVGLLIVLLAIFRSISLALVGWLVSAFPVALILGVMGFLGVEINMATVLIAGIALGIAVDDTIHYTFAFRDHLARGLPTLDALDAAVFTIGPRLVLTSVILVGGFATMTISAFLPTANFGLFSCLTILAALACDLLLLPILLRLWASAPSPGGRRTNQPSHHAFVGGSNVG